MSKCLTPLEMKPGLKILNLLCNLSFLGQHLIILRLLFQIVSFSFLDLLLDLVAILKVHIFHISVCFTNEIQQVFTRCFFPNESLSNTYERFQLLRIFFVKSHFTRYGLTFICWRLLACIKDGLLTEFIDTMIAETY
jgi:hypothetical protein